MAEVSDVISTRLIDQDLKRDLQSYLAAHGVKPAVALRLGLALLLEKRRNESPSLTLTDREIEKEQRADLAVFKALLGSILLAKYGFANDDHRERIAALIAGDRNLVATVARCAELGVNTDELLIAIVDEWLQSNPGGEIAELPREDIVWLELNFGEGSPQQLHISYIWGEADRADVETRWHWHRRLFAKLVADGTDYRELLVFCRTFGGWRLKNRPRLKLATVNGVRTLVIGKPDAEPEPSNTVEPTPRAGQIGGSAEVARDLALSRQASAKIGDLK